MESERLPRGVRRERHLKLGKGGLSDVEWTVQLLQLEHAGEHEGLRVNSTLGALAELERLGLIDGGDAAQLRDTWRLCTAARNGNYLWNGRANQADILPDDMYSLGGIAVYLGYDAHRGQVFENDLLGADAPLPGHHGTSVLRSGRYGRRGEHAVNGSVPNPVYSRIGHNTWPPGRNER